MKIRPFFLAIPALILAGCAQTSSPKDSSVIPSSEGSDVSLSSSEATPIPSSSVEAEPSEPSSSADLEPVLSSSTQEQESSSLSSSEAEESSSSSGAEVGSSSSATSSAGSLTPSTAAWELTCNALPANPAQGTLDDVAFTVTDADQAEVGFMGYKLRTGGGSKSGVSIDNTIQMSKESGYLYMTSGVASHIEFEIKHTGDYTGTPTVYSADEMDEENGVHVTLDRTEGKDGTTYIYSCELPFSRFRLANESSYALYITYIRNIG